MLEVGVTNTQGKVPVPLNHTEARTHFGAWCIVSAPLVCTHLAGLPSSVLRSLTLEMQILGLNLTDGPTVDSMWDIITNTEVGAGMLTYCSCTSLPLTLSLLSHHKYSMVHPQNDLLPLRCKTRRPSQLIKSTLDSVAPFSTRRLPTLRLRLAAGGLTRACFRRSSFGGSRFQTVTRPSS
jgi:hypothetical protein